MENYKELNAELVVKVQELKIHCGAYQREVLSLHSLYMEERSRRVEMQHNLLRILSSNFQQTVNEIDPNVKIVELFTDRNDIDELTPRCLSKEGSAGSRKQCEEKGRRSSAGLLVKELRRSTAMQKNDAMTTKSPSKRRSNERINDPATADSPSASGQSVSEISSPETSGDSISRTSAKNDKNCNEENKHIETSVIGNSFQAAELSQLENIMEEDDEQFVVKECYLQKEKYTPLQEIGNKQVVSPKVGYSASSPNSPESQPIHVVVQRGKRRFIKHQHQTDSIQEGRFERNRTESDLDTIARGSSTSKSVGSTNSPESFAMSEISISNFACATSSTPFKLQIDDDISTEYTVSSSVVGSTLTNITTNSTLTTVPKRPRRKCAPNHFYEPSLRLKLRNETAERVTRISGNRSRKRVD